MKYRRLGKSNLQVSEIGMGCWQLGGDFGPIEDSTSQDTLKAATAAGVNFFDTANVYGGGRSEQQVGAYLATGVDAVVATKLGRGGDYFPDGHTYENMWASLEGSCKNLGVDSVDLIQIHCVPPEVLARGDLFDVMGRLVDDGLCKNWGVSVETIAEAKICLQRDDLASLQIIFNLFRQNAAWDLLDEATDKDVGIIVRLPLASGLLTGKFAADHVFAESDHRNYNADGAAFSMGETLNGMGLAGGVAALDYIRPLVPEGMSLADFSLRWILDHPAVSSIIAGCSNPGQVKRNAHVSDLAPLSAEIHAALKEVYQAKIEPLVRATI
ncbi:MAG: aldo/keto reductase [Paracoccaceae bacterium]